MCTSLGDTCSSPSGCPAGTGIYAIAGRPSCANGSCCEPCAAPNQIVGSQCITAGEAECDQRGGVCADVDAGTCPSGYSRAGGTCGDGVVVPFSPCCLPSKDGG